MTRTYKLVGILLTVTAFALALHAPASSGAAKQATSAAAKVDLNSASEQELENLPGVGPATAKKIIAGRPYASMDDLSKAGVSAATMKKISPLVTIGSAASAPAQSAASKSAGKSATSAKSTPSSPAGPVDLNTASAAELKELPGVGDATAKKIISGRPYSSVADLSKAGVSASTISKITPLVTVGNVPAASTSSRPTSSPSSPPRSSTASTTAPTSSPSAPAPSAPPPSASSAPATQGTPGNGMVWVNTDSGVYHKEGTRYYGKTKAGKYMTEADAVKAGYRPAKNE
jgi:competence protein ComEA